MGITPKDEKSAVQMARSAVQSARARRLLPHKDVNDALHTEELIEDARQNRHDAERDVLRRIPDMKSSKTYGTGHHMAHHGEGKEFGSK